MNLLLSFTLVLMTGFFEFGGFPKDFETLVIEGGRLVISFFPASPLKIKDTTGSVFIDPIIGPFPFPKGKKGEDSIKDSTEEKEISELQTPEDVSKEIESVSPESIFLKIDWMGNYRKSLGGILIRQATDELKGFITAEKPKDATGIPAELPPQIKIHSALYFDDLSKDWRVLYEWDGHPVLVERNYGRGTVVLSADSYFFSNEALRKNRFPEVLAWVVGNNKKIIFDETHLGVEERRGVAGLARKYNLEFFYSFSFPACHSFCVEKWFKSCSSKSKERGTF